MENARDAWAGLTEKEWLTGSLHRRPATDLSPMRPQAPPVAADHLGNMPTPTTPPASVPGRSRVLIVDDDRINQLLYATILRKAGFDVATAGMGRDALALTAARPPDLVLLDLMMPEMLGTEVARRMRVQPGMGDVPLFLLTASSDQAHVEEGFQAGIEEYLVKPVDRVILVEKVRSVLAARGRSPERLRATARGRVKPRVPCDQFASGSGGTCGKRCRATSATSAHLLAGRAWRCLGSL